MNEQQWLNGRAALVVAHPGHELRVYGWLETARPRVFVLTDGSGRSCQSRLKSTDQVLSSTGAAPGDIYAPLTDVDVYTAILDHDFKLFTGIADELAAALVRERVTCVAGDAAEGYNPAHDACRLLVNAAVKMARRGLGKWIENFDFTLVARPDVPQSPCAPGIRLDLTGETFARKLLAARNYPELAAEVEAAFAGAGSVGLRLHPDLAAQSGFDTGGGNHEVFRVECLRAVHRFDHAFDETPFYERYGERQVAAGHYARVLRYREHMLPLAAALQAHAEKQS